jgi:translation initiation factor IF-2
MRPTVSLDNPVRTPVTPAPQMVVPEKTVMRGPQVVRIEKADMVPTPRPRTRPDGSPSSGPPRPAGIGTPLTRGGTGVKRAAGDAPGEDTEESKKKKAGPGGTRRRDLDGRRGEAEAKLREFTEADLNERAGRLRSAAVYRSGVDTHLRKSGRAGQGQTARTAAQTGEPIEIEEPITVRSLSASLGVKATDIIAKLMKQKVFATVNQGLDIETAQMIGLEYNVEIHVTQAPTLEEQLVEEFGDQNSIDPEKATPRPPVVTILGHVDHGKTSLLDKIRSANVAAGEAGGITQHIAAFSVELNKNGDKKKVTFIDTPGHQAFTAMRARGANMTDVVVLVIDAAQGIQPQTVESITHARAANVPIVVAMNKIDLPDASPDKILGQLAANDLNPVEWGGQVEVVRTSARTGQGIEDLIEILDLQAEILELKAEADAPARGIVVEARVDPGLGAVATVLVQNGTLKVGDVILAGSGFGRIRQLLDSYGKPIKVAPPSTPVLVSGFNEIPSAGDKFFVVEDVDRARSIAAERTQVARQADLAVSNRVSLDNIFAAHKDEKIKTINLIVKADVQGSVETLEKTITEQNTDEVRVKVIHSAVGAISESDVELATASDAVIIGFHVVPDEKAQSLAEQRHVEIRTYRVIYEIFDDLKKALSGMLEPEVREKHHGWIEIREVFKVSKVGNVAGCYVTEGHVSRGSKLRLVRDGAVVTEGLAIDTLRRIKEDVKEVKLGFECGLKIASYDDIKIGDKLEAYIREEFKRTL